MLTQISDNLWQLEHYFKSSGLAISSRMTVVRLPDGRLWLHSPVPINASVHAQLLELGQVSFIVAPNKTHHRFVSECAAAFPQASVFAAPGLKEKCPELPILTELSISGQPAWWPQLEYFLFQGIPLLNETVWFHRPSGTLILTDLCQWWQGELSFLPKCYALLSGVRQQLAVPATVQFLVRDHAAARLCAERILQWPLTRVITAHNAIIEVNAYVALAQALACFKRN